MKEPEKPVEAEVAEGEAATEDGKEAAAPAAEGDKKDGDEKKPLKKKNNQLIVVKIPRYDLKKICFYL